MIRSRQKILKQITLLGLSVQLVFTLSGFISNVSPIDCCHTKEIEKKFDTCCQETTQESTSGCELEYSTSAHCISNCGCIHSKTNNSDYTIQNNFELQKENISAVIYFPSDYQNKSVSFHFRQRIEKVHSPPLFLLDSILLI
ncbi:MAG: hypothetical protein NTX65_11635 [Ignavibacteriales bacterium]|nr:hypothetical protein [Ignavibacteriales bacterium]